MKTLKERLLEFLDNQKIPKGEFFKKIGTAHSNFSGEGLKSKLGEDIIVKILKESPNLNAEWLLLGVEPMTKDEITASETHGAWQAKYYQLLEKYNACLEEKDVLRNQHEAKSPSPHRVVDKP